MNAAAPQNEPSPTPTAPPAPTARSKARARKSKPPGRTKPATRAGMSGLDAAAKILADAGKPMRCPEIVERIFARRLWRSKGKTPAATLNAAMLREARDKGKASRFRKAGRGLFASTGKGR